MIDATTVMHFTTFFAVNALLLRVAHYNDCLSLMQFSFSIFCSNPVLASHFRYLLQIQWLYLKADYPVQIFLPLNIQAHV